ncbi:tyrosine-type recombinase/integrase [Streptomyces sp. NPDC059152]|uniref:tyrosine-type recombinase/integrase n=1 Tax=Streptomyces sp. NPDC059152 TaxID=3346742 RepID=UPI0036CF1928
MATIFQKCKAKGDPCRRSRCGHSWTVRYREPGGRSGSQREKNFPTKREAQDYGIKAENDKREGKYLDPNAGKILVRDYAREWLSRRSIKETTRKNYKNFFENHLIPRLGSKMLCNVMSSDIEKMCQGMCEAGLSRRTVYQSNMVPLRSLFRSTVAEKRISESPVALASLPRLKTKRVDDKSLPGGEAVGAIASAMRGDWAVSVWLMAGCGLRIGEVLALRDTDIAEGAMRLRRQFVRVKRDGVWKAEISPLKAREEGEWRDVPVPSLVEHALWHHLRNHGVGEDGYILHAHHGGHVLDSNYRTEFRSAVIKAGFAGESWTAHTLRHFFASSAIAGGLSLLEVSRWLGHATIQITADIYGHLTPDAGARMRSVMDGVLATTNVSRDDS